MKITLFSDIHLEYGGWDVPADSAADVVVLAGDIHTKGRGVLWAQKHFKQPVIYVPGNHEFWRHSNWEHELQRMRVLAENSNVHVLDNDALELDGIRFVGSTLWSDFKKNGLTQARDAASRTYNDLQYIRSGGYKRVNVDWLIMRHEKCVRYLTEALRECDADKTVVVTHHAPTYRSLPADRQEHPLAGAYASDLEHLMGRSRYWLHGHVHDSQDYTVSGTRVVCNPRGYYMMTKKGRLAEGGDHRNAAFNSHLLLDI